MMKNLYIILVFCILCLTTGAQEKMYISKSDRMTLGVLISRTDSIYFSEEGSDIFFRINGNLVKYSVASIDSIFFGENTTTVEISYNGNEVSVLNPLAFEGVSVAVNNADVIVTSVVENTKVSYHLTGTTSEGMFKIYSNEKFNLTLKGLNITNSDGPAVNIQSKKKCSLILDDGSSNSLTDGATYAAGTEDQKSTFFSEGQVEFSGSGSLSVKSLSNHAICSDDYVEVTGGAVTVTGAAKDGIHAGEYFSMTGGTLNITATGDGIDSEGFLRISGGSVTTSGMQANMNGISSDSTLEITGGTINISAGGNQSKGLRSTGKMNLGGGNITVNTAGSAVLVASGSGFDPAYCAGIKCDSSIVASGAGITVKCTGNGGKGISSGRDITISGGTLNISTTGNGSTYKNTSAVTDSYNATCLTADGNLSILGGSVTTVSTGTGGKGINVDGSLTVGDENHYPTLNITTSGSKFLVTGSGQNADYNEPKAIKADGSVIFNNGNVTISSNDDAIKSGSSVTFMNTNVTILKCYEAVEAPFITVNSGNISVTGTNDGFNATKGTGSESNDGSCVYLNGGYTNISISNGDGLDSNGNMVMTGGTVIVHGPQSQPEVGMDFNGTFTISGGFLVVSGTNSNMTEGPSTSSGQYSFLARTNSANSSLFHLEDAGGNNIVTFKPIRSFYSMIVSSSDLKSGSSYKIYTGGTSTGTLKDGLYTGGSYSGGTLKKTFTITGKLTSISF